jgi:hypothetical protein
MNGHTKATHRRRSVIVIVLFTIVAVVAGFIFLWIVSGESLLAELIAVAIIVLLAFAHYLVWGRGMSTHRDAVYREAAIEQAEARFPDTFNLPLDDRERAELLTVLDQALAADTGIQAAPSLPGAAAATATRNEVLRGVRDRLLRYGA